MLALGRSHHFFTSTPPSLVSSSLPYELEALSQRSILLDADTVVFIVFVTVTFERDIFILK